MRMPRVSIRTMMILTALAGILLGLEAKRRRDALLEVRSWHALQEEWYRSGAEQWIYVPPHPARAEYHAAMRAKYARAASRPWLPVTPDPPEPR